MIIQRYEMMLFHISFQIEMTLKLLLEFLVLFVISYVTPAFNLNSLLKNRGGLFFANYELLLLLEGVCILVCIYYLILLLARNIEIRLILD